MVSRRSLLNFVTVGTALAVAGMGTSGLLRSCAPSSDVKAAFKPLLDIDVSLLEPGKDHRYAVDNKPLGIHVLTDEELAALANTPLGNDQWVNRNYPHPKEEATADNLIQPGPVPFVALWLVTTRRYGVVGDGAGEFGGYFDPYLAGHYDLLGRIHKGIGRNLAVPYLKQQSETVYSVFADATVPLLNWRSL